MAPDRPTPDLGRVREQLRAHDEDSATSDADVPPQRRTEEVDRVREQLREHDEDAGRD
ncbi:MAG TPA: hypothetical protein VN238_02810 [Solirubrobacteraceae bacterium]|nr:hypothetical protein [Solirubrobacteraceae bacterium]